MGTESYWSRYQAPLKHTFNDNSKKIPRISAFSGNEKGKDFYDQVYEDCGAFIDEFINFPQFGVQNAYSADISINLSGEHGGEVSIAVDPNNKNILWECNMYKNLNQPSYVYCYSSSDKGLSWNFVNGGPDNITCGDPTGIIHRNGSSYVSFLRNDRNIYISQYDQINGWQAPVLIQEPPYDCSFDKPYFAIDNTIENGYFYCAWQPSVIQGSPQNCPDQGILIERSTDSGLTWEEDSQLISSEEMYGEGHTTSHNGANIQFGPNGEVYVAWACMDLTSYVPHPQVHNETGLVFVRSLDRGVSYQGDGGKEGYLIRPIHGIANYMAEHDWHAMIGNRYLNSMPSMCVDKSYGPHRGRIYIVWANNGDINWPDYNGENIYTYVIYSDNQGEPNSWTEPILINPASQYDNYYVRAFYPWISCDDETGVLSVIYYWMDDYNSENYINTNVAMSRDFGATWDISRIGDFSFLGSNFFYGDYIGICSKQGLVYPVFSDSRNSYGEDCLPQVYISPFYAWNCVDHYPDSEIDPSTSVNQIIDPDYIRKWEAMNYIHSRNKISANAVAVYNAGYEIKLLPGEDPYDPDAPEFWAHDGSLMHAYIERCQPFDGNVPNPSPNINKIAKVNEPPSINIIIDIYPNPTQGMIYIKNNTYGDYIWNMKVETSLGTTILTQEDLSTKSTSVDISKFPKGIYFVKVWINEKSVIKKLILN